MTPTSPSAAATDRGDRPSLSHGPFIMLSGQENSALVFLEFPAGGGPIR